MTDLVCNTPVISLFYQRKVRHNSQAVATGPNGWPCLAIRLEFSGEVAGVPANAYRGLD